MSATECMLSTEHASPEGLHEGEMGKKLQGKCLALVSPVTPIKLGCLCMLITVLTVATVVLSVMLSMRNQEEVIERPVYPACPRNWIGFGSKCFYFSEDLRNWTRSQASCMGLEAELAKFETLKELNFLKRYKGPSDHWIGLHRESSQQPWKWADNTDYSNLVSVRGEGERAYLNDNGISSARVYADRKWICSKPNSYTLQCQIPSTYF